MSAFINFGESYFVSNCKKGEEEGARVILRTFTLFQIEMN